MRSEIIATISSLALVGTVTLGGSSLFFSLSNQMIDLAQGRRVFEARCASCHSLEDHEGAGHGPSLRRIGMIAGTRVAGQDAEQYILTSILRPDALKVAGFEGAAMPRSVADGLSRDDVLALVGVLTAQGGRFRPDRLLRLEFHPRDSSRDDASGGLDIASIEQGRLLFLGKGRCVTCHSLRRGPGADLLAPNLAQAGLSDRKDLEQSLIEPSRRVGDGYHSWSVASHGIPYNGRLLSETDQQVRILSIGDRGHAQPMVFSRSDLDPLDEKGNILARSPVSRMPPATEALSRAELGSVLDFLQTLR